MISLDLATRLRDAGLAWKPATGDRFAIPDRDLDDDVFVLSNMTIEVHELPEGQIIGFNGTTEWALDDVEKDEAIWLPREDQLRELLGGTFRRLERDSADYRVTIEVLGAAHEFAAGEAAEAYGKALLHLVRAAQ
ncbi:pilus assembly protein CpaE [Phytohabitans sp. ZYX-F-186]|uniref:Pilus assembly protein CpaE n=1 Tax=Phytohabitans maris TaxID=3071409 RepID=A0ABU0ZTZ7_9ACTN|nr:pilus assembly protein CpaE [Phytohabitans sp. ZYX-F-186]MDQ7910518.1 pilus assembly protein CpaE [Phytohabitans sp. ZYX-F-186]